MTTLAPSFLIGSLFILAGNEDNHNILDGFEISARSDQGLMSKLPLSVWKNLHRLIMGEIL